MLKLLIDSMKTKCWPCFEQLYIHKVGCGKSRRTCSHCLYAIFRLQIFDFTPTITAIQLIQLYKIVVFSLTFLINVSRLENRRNKKMQNYCVFFFPACNVYFIQVLLVIQNHTPFHNANMEYLTSNIHKNKRINIHVCP